MDRNDLMQRFRRIAAEIEPKDYGQVTENDVVTSLGIDSLGLSELVGALEQELGIRIPEEQLAGVRTVKQLFDLVETAIETRG